MQILSLKKSIYDRSKNLNVGQINLEFSGGSDEGRLDVNVDLVDDRDMDGDYEREMDELISDIYEWADEAYNYTGDDVNGYPYGDDICYDLVSGEVRHEKSYMTTRRSPGVGLLIEEEK